jgi:hypothetical protein
MDYTRIVRQKSLDRTIPPAEIVGRKFSIYPPGPGVRAPLRRFRVCKSTPYRPGVGLGHNADSQARPGIAGQDDTRAYFPVSGLAFLGCPEESWAAAQHSRTWRIHAVDEPRRSTSRFTAFIRSNDLCRTAIVWCIKQNRTDRSANYLFLVLIKVFISEN